MPGADDLETHLLRGAEAEAAIYPVGLWSLLRSLCEREPQLHVYVLAWDYSLVYSVERQWLQSLHARWTGHPRLHMAFQSHPDVIGAHHQKFVVIDDKIACLSDLRARAAHTAGRGFSRYESKKRCVPSGTPTFGA